MAKNDESTQTHSASSTCTGKIRVPTEAETAILAEMKSIKEQGRELKRRLNELAVSGSHADSNEVPVLKEALVRFKEEWERLDRKRRAAARERMVQLGHEEP
jgi:hypothetical protein